MSFRIMYEKNAMDDLKAEIRHLKLCKHPNIIRLLDERTTEDHHYMFFDFCNGGTLSDLKKISETVNEGIVRSIGL